MNLKNTLFLLALGTLSWSCGDDEGASPTSLAVLEGDWTTQEWVTGTSGSTGLLTIRFDQTTATGEIISLSANDWGFSCEEVTFRELVATGNSTFSGEGLIRFTGGSSEWVPATLTVDGITLSIALDCSSCSNDLFTLTKLPEGSTSSVIIDSDIDDATIFTKVNCLSDAPDYLVTDIIDVNDVLTVEPGVVIAFEANAGLVINLLSDGVIIADGTATEPITFTGATKTKGFWRGIRIETNDVRNEMDYVIIEYAGSDEIADDINSGVNAGLALDWEPGGFIGSLKLTNSTIRESDGYGLVVEKLCILRAFENNTFEDNTNAAVLLEAPNVGELDGSSSYTGGNGYEGVEIAGTTANNLMTDDATWPGLLYYVSDDIEVRSTLTIEAGATFEFEANTSILFDIDQFGPEDGIIIAEGTSADPITFTGINKTPGYWAGIIIQSNSNQSRLSNCVVEYGGSDATVGSLGGNVSLDKDGAFDAPVLSVTNSTVRNSAGCGIVVDSFGATLNESGNTFTSNAEDNICN